jgi:hypothetical protein
MAKKIENKKSSEKNLGGRPSKLPLINKEHFEGMCRIQCTKDEICSIFEIHEETLTKWCHVTYSLGFSDIYKKLSSTGKMSLRRQQFKTAESGNVTMQIWLGKQNTTMVAWIHILKFYIESKLKTRYRKH